MVDTKNVTSRDVRIVMGTCGVMVMFVTPIFLAGVAITKLDAVQTSSIETAEKVTKLEQKLSSIDSMRVVLDQQAAEINRLRNRIDNDKIINSIR